MTGSGRRPRILLAAAAVAVLAVVGLAVVLTGPTEPATAPAAAPPAPTSTTSTTPPKPAWLEIPSIGVRTGQVIELGLEPDGALQVPGDAVTAGWFTQSPRPGETGPAIIAGHVDYRKVPGVFHRLHELRPGAEATVHRGDGTSAVFTVYQVERYPKAEFPTERVYGNTASPELRLITCGGAFDRSAGEYVDNVVAYARMK